MDQGTEWARNIGRASARLGQRRAVPLHFGEDATKAFLAGFDQVKAEEAEERRIAQAGTEKR
jgi:hypothetical protein